METPRRPFHWLFDHLDRFPEPEQTATLMLFEGKTCADLRTFFDLGPESLEVLLARVQSCLHSTGMHHLRITSKMVDSGRFWQKWGIRPKKVENNS